MDKLDLIQSGGEVMMRPNIPSNSCYGILIEGMFWPHRIQDMGSYGGNTLASQDPRYGILCGNIWPRQIQMWSFVEEHFGLIKSNMEFCGEIFWPHKIQGVEFYGGCLAPSNPNMEFCGGNILVIKCECALCNEKCRVCTL